MKRLAAFAVTAFLVGGIAMAKNDFTGNISKARREKLIAEVAEIKAFLEKSAGADTNAARLLSFAAGLEKEVRGKKYGLVFEEHRERVDVELDENLPVLTEVEERFISRRGAEPQRDAKNGRAACPHAAEVPLNFLIEGDNLAALKLLEKTHRGKIDLIYIDPPYNTGNKDFIYNDSYVDKTDTFRHSKWLSFMQKRLEIAQRLMSDKGVIFISIDDNEQAALKLLCDDVLGHDNFVANIAWQRTYSIRNDSKGIPNEVEYILVYSKKQGWQPKQLPRTEKMNKAYKNPDNDKNGPWMSGSPVASEGATHQGMVYAIQSPFTGKMIYPSDTAHWRYQQDTMLEYMNGWCEFKLEDLHDENERAKICGVPSSEIRKDVKAIVLAKSLEESREKAESVLKRGNWPRFYFTSNGKGGIRRKVYLEKIGGRISTNFYSFEEVGHTDEAKKEIKNIFNGSSPFDTPKPVRLLARILQIASTNNSTVLDFFAGSGTTGHAVMKLNAEDGGKRKFILVTNNENGICEKVTYERLKRVMEKEGYDARLKYFKVGYVPIAGKLYFEYADTLLKHVRELVELENAVDISHDRTVEIVLTDKELEKLAKRVSAAKSAKIRAVYVGHDVLMGEEEREALETRGVEIHRIPQYYYPELED